MTQASARAQADAAAQAAADAQAAAIAAWCERSEPFRFFVEEVSQDATLAACIPAQFKAQAQAGALHFSLSEKDITERNFSIVINDPVLLQPEMGMVLSNEIRTRFSELPLSATAPGNRYEYLRTQVLEHYRSAFQTGSDPYTGVKLKLHLSAIMDSQGEMVPQIRNAKDLPAGTAWLNGFKSVSLTVDPSYVEQGLFSLEEYRGLHEYATVLDLIKKLDGGIYSPKNAKQRQYLTPKPGANATFQFQLQPRLNPTANVYVPGMTDIRWSGFMVIGLNSGGLAQETARPAIAVPQETEDMPDVPTLPLPTTPVTTPTEEIF